MEARLARLERLCGTLLLLTLVNCIALGFNLKLVWDNERWNKYFDKRIAEIAGDVAALDSGPASGIDLEPINERLEELTQMIDAAHDELETQIDAAHGELETQLHDVANDAESTKQTVEEIAKRVGAQ